MICIKLILKTLLCMKFSLAIRSSITIRRNQTSQLSKQKSHPCSTRLIPSALNLLNSAFIWEASTFKPYNVILKITVVSLIISSFSCHYLYGCDEGGDTSILLTCSTKFLHFPFFSRLVTTARGDGFVVKRDLKPCKLWFLENDGILGSIMPGLRWGSACVTQN